MAYKTVALMARNQALLNRIIACVAAEYMPNPIQYAEHYIWHFCARPDWDDAWEYAMNVRGIGPEDPDYEAQLAALGDDAGVITDDLILLACRHIAGSPPEAMA